MDWSESIWIFSIYFPLSFLCSTDNFHFVSFSFSFDWFAILFFRLCWIPFRCWLWMDTMRTMGEVLVSWVFMTSVFTILCSFLWRIVLEHFMLKQGKFIELKLCCAMRTINVCIFQVSIKCRLEKMTEICWRERRRTYCVSAWRRYDYRYSLTNGKSLQALASVLFLFFVLFPLRRESVIISATLSFIPFEFSVHCKLDCVIVDGGAEELFGILVFIQSQTDEKREIRAHGERQVGKTIERRRSKPNKAT